MSSRQNYWMNRVVRSCLELWSSSWNLHNPIGDPPKPIPHNPCSDEQGPSVSDRASLSFFLSFLSFFLLGCLSHRSCMLEPCFRMFLKEIGRTHRYSNRYQPILSLYHFDPRSDHPSVELNKFKHVTTIPSCWTNSYIPDWGRKGFDHSSKFMFCCPCCEPKKVLSSFSCFHRCL